jgi:transmembrane sensor
LDREAHARWKSSNAEHQAAYGEVEYLYEVSAALRADPLIAAATRRALRRTDRNRMLRWLVRSAVAACIAVAGIYIPLHWAQMTHSNPPVATQYATHRGQQLAVSLPDGSSLLLDSDSAVEVRFDARGRSTRLLGGQDEFKIIHDASRPFTVDVGIGTIRDVGTEFTARRDQDQVTVTVEQGAVDVTSAMRYGAQLRSAQLAPGDQLQFDGKGTLWTTRQVDLKAVTGWKVGELTFEDAPLAQIVEEMNRYTYAQVRLGDPRLSALRVSGVFHTGDQQSFLLALESGWRIRLQQEPTGNVALYSR